jgi:large subunit ribosomal protein L31e
MATLERTYTINVRKAIVKVPRYRRTKKAVSSVRKFLMKHMKASEDNVKLGRHLNLKLWERGIKNPITRITVVAKKDEKGIVTAEIPNIPVKKPTRRIEKQLKKQEAEAKKKEEKAKTPDKKETAKAPVAGKKTESKPVEKKEEVKEDKK